MKVNRAYKLNKEKQPAEEKGKFLYYFYNNHKLDSIAVDEEQWEKLVELDTEMYNGNRRHKDHDVNFQKILDKYDEIVKRLECTAEEFYKERIAKPYVEKRNKRYQKYLDENYVLVVDENDTRPIKEQLTAFMEHCKKLDKKYKNKVVTENLKITE